MANLKIDEVFNAVRHVRNRAMEKDQYAKPKIRVYMSNHYWLECMSEFKNIVVSEAEFNFYESQTILGYQVYKVLDKVNVQQHPPFEVVECS